MHKHFHLPFKNVELPRPQHGWRALLGEIGVIVIGVLIALGAEQALQAIHWHEKTNAAERAMLIEQRDDNAPQAYLRLMIFQCLDELTSKVLEHSQGMRMTELVDSVNSYLAIYNTYDSEAWRAIQSSDVANHVGADRLIRWSMPYRLTPSLTNLTHQENITAADLRAALPQTDVIGPDDARSLRKYASELRTLNLDLSATALLFLFRLKDQGIEVGEPVIAAMERDARAKFGGCVRRPDLSRTYPFSQLHDDAVFRDYIMKNAK